MPWVLTRGERRRRNRLQGGRLHLGTVAGIKSEWWPTSSRNRWPACVGIRMLGAKQQPSALGIVGGSLCNERRRLLHPAQFRHGEQKVVNVLRRLRMLLTDGSERGGHLDG
jgi:hypothetical protein